MGSKLVISSLFGLVLLALMGSTEAHVELGAYNITCPKAEQIVYEEMTNILQQTPDLAGALLRLHYVDCFVRGCEASILLNSTATNTAEKDAPLNKNVRGYEVIDSIKAKLEVACPGIVSCADIIALTARDSIRLTNGPNIPIGTGRRDGNGSSAADVDRYLPSSSANISSLIAFFANYNLTVKDLVVLSGAHTIGKAHCYSFSDRLYNFSGNGSSDPSLDSTYASTLKQQCVQNDMTTLVELDPETTPAFDLDYYTKVSQMKGLFTSDSALLDNDVSKAYVLAQANATSPTGFYNDFITSFMTMGKVGALTHKKGEIRKTCSALNPFVAQPPAHAPTGSGGVINVVSTLLSASLAAMVFFFQF
ncbi:hypothetical protein LUZ60_001368 [Juncus effusus]|nr:hypothetical protein LUZ60_001368 [Juncus effusus]